MKFAKAALFWLGLVAACSQGIAQTDEDEGKKIVFQDGSTYDNDFRVWSTAEGEFTVVAKFDSFLDAEVVRLIRKDTGKVIDVRISILAPDDRELLKKIRKDIALKMLPNSKEASLEKYKLGIEKVFRLEKEYREKTSAINTSQGLLTVQKDRKLKAAKNAYERALDGVKINIHVLIDDVKEIGGKLFVEGVFALAGDEGEGLEVLTVSLPNDPSFVEKLQKEAVVCLKCIVGQNVNANSTAIIKMIDQEFDLVITEVSQLSDIDQKTLFNAKVWYEDIAAAIVGARLEWSAPLLKKQLTILPTLATLQRIAKNSNINDAQVKKFLSFFSGYPEFMGEVEKLRYKYIQDISNSTMKRDVNEDEYASFQRACDGITKDMNKLLRNQQITVLVEGKAYRDERYGTVFKISGIPNAFLAHDRKAQSAYYLAYFWRNNQLERQSELNFKTGAGFTSEQISKRVDAMMPPALRFIQRLVKAYPRNQIERKVDFKLNHDLNRTTFDEELLKKVEGRIGLFAVTLKFDWAYVYRPIPYRNHDNAKPSLAIPSFFTTKYGESVKLYAEFDYVDVNPVDTVNAPPGDSSRYIQSSVPVTSWSEGPFCVLWHIWNNVYPADAF